MVSLYCRALLFEKMAIMLRQSLLKKSGYMENRVFDTHT